MTFALVLAMALPLNVAAESTYTIQPGDVLWRIARDNGLDWEELAEYNDLENPHLIYAGDTLKIPTAEEMAAMVSGDVTITVLATSDLHGRIYPYEYAIDSEDSDAGLAKIQTVLKAEKAVSDNIILMDLGDTVQDNSAELFNDDPIHPMIDALNYMGFDIWTLGNHEFNFEKAFLMKNIDTFDGTVLAANIHTTDGDYLSSRIRSSKRRCGCGYRRIAATACRYMGSSCTRAL